MKHHALKTHITYAPTESSREIKEGMDLDRCVTLSCKYDHKYNCAEWFSTPF